MTYAKNQTETIQRGYKMEKITEETIEDLIEQGLTLTDYNMSVLDFQSDRVLVAGDLTFDYKTDDGTTGTLNMGDTLFEIYEDCGDPCIDDPYLISLFTNDARVKATFDWSDFYEPFLKMAYDSSEYN